ncbi:MAG: alpha/beta hydrolase [archaeon]|nr:alpha/beta hydrolase [archaeon]
MSTFIYQDHKIWYSKTGEDGPPMLLIHNAGNDHRIWDFQVEYFSKNYQVYAMDMLGYGNSDSPDNVQYTLDFYTEVVATFIKEVLTVPVILIGNCIGAAQVLKYSLENPKNVKALVLINLASENTLKDGLFGFMYKMTKKKRIKKILDSVAKMKMTYAISKKVTFGRLYGGIRGIGEPEETKEEFREHVRELYTGPNNMTSLYNLLLNFSSFTQLDNITIPEGFPKHLVIWGENNAILHGKGGKKWAEQMEPVQCEFYGKCGHLVMREKNEEVNALIDSLLKQV